MAYCDYCGTGYWGSTCKECGAGMTICGCEPAKTICDECDTEWMDLEDAIDALKATRKSQRETVARAEAAEKELKQFKSLLKTELDQLAGQIEEEIHKLRDWVEEG